MNSGALVQGQHKEVGWSRAGEWCVLVKDGKRYRQLGEACDRGKAERIAAANDGAIVVQFHTDEWHNLLLDGSALGE